MAQDSETPKPVEHAVRPELRSYGRRHGRKLSVRQEQLWGELLPRVTLDLATPFEPGAREVWLEIGFGGGEHLVWQAQRNPNALLIGAEPFRDGVIKVLDLVARALARPAHDHVDERVHPLQRPSERCRIGDRPFDVVHEIAVLRWSHVEDPQLVPSSQVGRHERPDHA